MYKYMYYNLNALDSLVKMNGLDDIFNISLLIFEGAPTFEYILPLKTEIRGFNSLEDAKTFIKNNYSQKSDLILTISELFISCSRDICKITDNDYTKEFILNNLNKFVYNNATGIVQFLSDKRYTESNRKENISSGIDNLLGSPSARLLRMQHLVELLLMYVTGQFTEDEQNKIKMIVNIFPKDSLLVTKDFNEVDILINKFLDEEALSRSYVDKKCKQWDIDNIE